MDNYEKTLDNLSGFVRKYSLSGDVYGDLIVLQELVDKQEKYRWHDLRKDIDDLPKEDGFVMAMFKGECKPCIISCLNGEFGEYVTFEHFELEGHPIETYFQFYDNDTDEVIAWKYIEEFKDDTRRTKE